MESTTDVAKLLQVTKGVAHDANDLKHPTMQTVNGLKSLKTAQQKDEEHLIHHCKCFVSLNKIADRASGEIAPLVVAKEKHDSPWERSKWNPVI